MLNRNLLYQVITSFKIDFIENNVYIYYPDIRKKCREIRFFYVYSLFYGQSNSKKKENITLIGRK